MNSIVVTPKSQTEYKFLSSLLTRLGIASKVLLEDIGLSLLMRDVDRTKR